MPGPGWDEGKAGHVPETWLRAQVLTHAGTTVRTSIILGALAAALVVPQAWLVAAAISPVVMQVAGADRAWLWLLPVLPLLLLRFGIGHLADRAAVIAGSRVTLAVRQQLFRKISRSTPTSLAGRDTGEILTSALEGVDALGPYVTRFLAHLGVLAALPLVILAVILPRDPMSALILIVTAPVIPLFMVVLGSRAAQLNRLQLQRLARLSAQLLDGLQRLTTIKALNAGAREAENLAEAAEDYRSVTMGVLRVAFLSALALEFFATVGIAMVAVLVGFRLLAGTLDYEAGFFVLLLVPEFYAPLRQLGIDYHARMEALAAADRLAALEGEVPAPKPGVQPAFGPAIAVACENVAFDWDDGRPALRDVSFRLEPGTITAIAGASGSGKSSLLSLLLGLRQPRSGRVLYDGHALSDLDIEHLLRRVAVVPQRPHMFAGSLRDNIRLADAQASDEAVRIAARRAQADRFIEALPMGYDTPLGEHGRTLSGGQVQRIALARAFLKQHASFLLLDEGMAGLDPDTEAEVTAAIRQLARGRTTLLVAHRQTTLGLADRILVMKDGRIVASGTPAQFEASGLDFADPQQDAEFSE